MSVLYAISARLGGAGIGRTAYYGAEGLYRHGLLQRVYCGSYVGGHIPQPQVSALGLTSRALRKLASLDPTARLWHWQNRLFDSWVVRQLGAARLLHVWNNGGLRSLERARQLGMLTVVQRASAHPRYQERLLREEHARWGLAWQVPEASVQRSEAELALADYVLVPSAFVKESFGEHDIEAGRCLLVPFGVDAERFHPGAERKAGPLRIVFVGQIGLRKGAGYLLEAWQRLARHPEWSGAELVLVGRVQETFKPILDRYADLPGLRLPGFRDPVALYQSADLFVCPSIEEGSALVTYEAMACGLPSVVTPNAGSIVRDGVDGLVVPIRSPEALADAMERLRQDRDLALQLGTSAREHVAPLTWRRHGDLIAERYRKILEGGHLNGADRA